MIGRRNTSFRERVGRASPPPGTRHRTSAGSSRARSPRIQNYGSRLPWTIPPANGHRSRRRLRRASAASTVRSRSLRFLTDLDAIRRDRGRVLGTVDRHSTKRMLRARARTPPCRRTKAWRGRVLNTGDRVVAIGTLNTTFAPDACRIQSDGASTTQGGQSSVARSRRAIGYYR